MKQKIIDHIGSNAHLKADVPHSITSFRRWMEEYDKAYGLKPIP